jgi:hypothetical protein
VVQRVMFAYSNTGKGHKSVAEALAESITSSSEKHLSPQVEHVDIYRLANVFLFRGGDRHYETLCRHAQWLYDILFRITDNPTAKNVITRVILRIYGAELAKTIARIAPDVIIVVHPLFMSDVLCKLRDRLGAKWRIVSFVTDLGVVHAGWTAADLDLALFVSSRQIQKLRSQGCLPPSSRTAVTKAPVRGTFVDRDHSIDEEVVEVLGLQRPYVVYVPGLQSARAQVRQVGHLANDYPEMQIVLIGSISGKLAGRLRRIRSDLVHLHDLADYQMAAAFRNAEVVSGKAGPAVMAETATVGARFIPTAEVGRQEAGNAAAGRALYGIDPVPWWGEVYRGVQNSMVPESDHVMDEAEVRMHLIGGSA